MAYNPNKELKKYYSISEVSEMLELPETLLRYWEKEFPNISPKKAGRGIRQYTKEDIEEVKLVQHLVKEKGMTLAGAREAIKRNHGGQLNKQIETIELLKRVRDNLQQLNKELNTLV